MHALARQEPLKLGAVTLLPIEGVLLHMHIGRGGGWITASKEPLAIIVGDAARRQAFATDGSEMPLDALRERVPDLDAVLATV